ncbi:MAG: HlyD family type I secretion periplasmic adaptor subunit [Burkholderiaceae bacterium]|nr:HlyD family type I secretion periplasmic adaptor subunit [Burkholderiaceae bacterium]
MEPTNQLPLTATAKTSTGKGHAQAVDFLPDADALEKTPLPSGMSATIYILVALAAAVVLWASIFEVDQVVTARGRLVTSQPNVVLQPLETAHISALNVKAGQIVKKGQVLAVLDPTFIQSDLAQAQDRLKSLNAEVQRLEREHAGKTLTPQNQNPDELLQSRLQRERLASYQARLLRLDESIARLRATMVTNTQDAQSLEARVKSLRDIESMNEQLTRQQFQSNMKLLESRERRQEVERELISTRNRSVEMKKQLAEAEAERDAFVRESRQKSTEDLVTVRRERDSIAEQVKKAERRSRLIELTAPTDAVVLEVAARSTGSVIQAAEPLITLVPLGDDLEAEVQITSQDVGYVKLHDPIRLKIDAFPFQKHGLIKGTLETLGQDAFTKDAKTSQTSAPYYLGRAALTHNELRNLPRNAPMIPGMTLSAEIVVGKRTVMSYVMYPVIRGLSEAAREP